MRTFDHWPAPASVPGKSARSAGVWMRQSNSSIGTEMRVFATGGARSRRNRAILRRRRTSCRSCFSGVSTFGAGRKIAFGFERELGGYVLGSFGGSGSRAIWHGRSPAVGRSRQRGLSGGSCLWLLWRRPIGCRGRLAGYPIHPTDSPIRRIGVNDMIRTRMARTLPLAFNGLCRWSHDFPALRDRSRGSSP